MLPTSAKALYAVEPQSERFARWLTDTLRWAIRLYWDLFVAIPMQIIMIGMALICLIVGVMDVIKHPGNAISDLPLIGMGAAFLLINRVRSFFWALLLSSIVWLPFSIITLIDICGEDYKPASATANIGIAIFCLLPPLVAAAFIDQARHRKPVPPER